MIDLDKEQTASVLKGSLLEFTRFFFKHITGRDFILSNPPGRESHQIIVCRALTQIFYLQIPGQRLILNMPPGYGKSTFVAMYVSWAMAHYPDSQFLYISFAHDLAAKHTAFIKQIMGSAMYRYLFEVDLSMESRAKDFFKTTKGGSVRAFGAQGPVVGQDGGLPNLDRSSGGVIIDDPIKPDAGHSDAVRENVTRNYEETIRQRTRGMNVPIIFIGQRIHEDDLANFLLTGRDIRPWHPVIMKAIDEAGNPLYPEVQAKEDLMSLKEKSPYVYASQYQQDPLPAGGALFKTNNFVLLPQEPKILMTFITADTAETDKTYNDATAFSFWGVYQLETEELALHWIDAVELHIEPKYLKEEFLSFYNECMLHPVKPRMAAIEKKSTGVTLVSILEDMRGIEIRAVKRTAASGSKTTRFIEMQPIIASKLISLPEQGKHTKMCIEHMTKITANDSHRRDDLCFVKDTLIATNHGDIPIQNIKAGDKVITPFGIGNVTHCGCTGSYRVIKKLSLEGTLQHPVFVGNKFKHLDNLYDDDKISKLNFSGILSWRLRKLLFSMESPIGSWGRENIILVSQKKGWVPKDCMLQFGSFIAEKQFLRAMLFIIKIMITLIIVSKTWSAYRAHNTLKTMKKIGCDGIIAMKERLTLNWCKNWLRNGILVLKDWRGIKKMQKMELTNPVTSNALYAKSVSQHEQQNPVIARKIVSEFKMQRTQEKEEQLKEVYNLTVEEFGVYYANGILVSNCDNCYDAVKIALIDKTLYVVDNKDNTRKDVARQLTSQMHNISQLRAKTWRQ